jgi:hypothetical protein
MRYQSLDNEIVTAIKATAKSVGRKNFGYQRSPELVKAGQEIILHKAISSCVHRNKAYSTKVIDLAERLKYELMPIEKMTRKLAMIHKHGVEKTDGEHQMRWLEELATARAEWKEGGDPQRELQKMISQQNSG